MITLIDNYDSFSYNLVHYVESLGEEVKVLRNDAATPEEIIAQKPELIIISPGPSNPENAGICLELIKKAAGKIPVFGVCLGMQSIAQAFGGKIVRAQKVMHGKISAITHNGKYCFKNLPCPLNVVRYHSLAAERDTLPDCFEITAQSDDGEIMALRHKDFLIEGVQFHPESIMSSGGKRLLANFIEEAKNQAKNENA